MLAKILASEIRWVHTLLMLSTAAVALILVDLVAKWITYFSDVLLMLVVAWLFAFILSPVVGIILRAMPKLPRSVAVVIVYGALFIGLTAVLLIVAASLGNSIVAFSRALPDLLRRLPEITAPWEGTLNNLGITLDLNNAAQDLLTSINGLVADAGPVLANLTFQGLGLIGNLMLVVFLSLFIVVDKDRMLAFVNRVVPPRYADEARLFQTSVASSFGGFLRGQVIQGLVFGAFAAVGSLVLGLPYWEASTALVVILQIIPFFGPFFSWAPPVIVAVLTSTSATAAVVGWAVIPLTAATPNQTLPIFIVMAVGWFITMNVVQPRVMASTVGIHPVMVLASVLIGIKVWSVIGAIFAIPVAAVTSAFFFHYLNRSTGGPRDVASRAARRLEERQGRRVRVPTAPGVVVASASDGQIVGPGARPPTRTRAKPAVVPPSDANA